VKAARIHRFGPPDVVVVEDVPVPLPGPGEVLVRVMAAGVAPWDAIIREGKSKVSPQPPLTLGSDFSGIVDKVGPGVAHFALADEVYGVTNPQFCGAQADFAVATAGMVARKPESLNHVTTFPMPPAIRARRRWIKARMKISLSSASFAMSERNPFAVTSRNSPGSATRPRAIEPAPEIKTMSPENFPGPWVANMCSPESLVITISSFPESTTKQGIPKSPASNSTSPVRTVLAVPYGRMRSTCAGVKTGKTSACGSGVTIDGGIDALPHMISCQQPIPFSQHLRESHFYLLDKPTPAIRP
jgi:hypothetical protein